MLQSKRAVYFSSKVKFTISNNSLKMSDTMPKTDRQINASFYLAGAVEPHCNINSSDIWKLTWPSTSSIRGWLLLYQQLSQQKQQLAQWGTLQFFVEIWKRAKLLCLSWQGWAHNRRLTVCRKWSEVHHVVQELVPGMKSWKLLKRIKKNPTLHDQRRQKSQVRGKLCSFYVNEID